MLLPAVELSVRVGRSNGVCNTFIILLVISVHRIGPAASVCAPPQPRSHTHGNIHLSLAVLHPHVCHALLLHPSQRLQSCSALPISMSTIASSSLNPARLYTSLYSASSGTHPSRSAVSTKCIKCFEVVQRIHYVRRTSLQSHPHTSPPTPHSHILSF